VRITTGRQTLQHKPVTADDRQVEAGVATMNRALQLRAIDGLRQRLLACADPASGLPRVERLTGADAEELRAIGEGRLGAVAIVAADTAYRSPLSVSGWRPSDLAAEARGRARASQDPAERAA
jgi:hypothetical protein